MRLSDYLALIRERAVLMVAVIAVTTITAIGLFALQDPEHVASVRLRARAPAPLAAPEIEEAGDQADLVTEGELLRSTAVAERVAVAVDSDLTPSQLIDRVDVRLVPGSSVITIAVSDPEAPVAIALANAFSLEYLEFRRETLLATLDAEVVDLEAELSEEIDELSTLDALLTQLEPGSTEHATVSIEREQTLNSVIRMRDRLDALADRRTVSQGFGEIIEPASSATAVRETSLPRSAVFGMLVGIPLGLAAVLLLDALNPTIRSRDEAERAVGAPVLGVVPIDPDWVDPAEPRLVTVLAPHTPTSEAFRTLALNLSRASAAASATSLVVTGPGDGDGKTTAAANLAMALAESGRAVALVEADLRHPRVHAFFGAEADPGLTELLAGEADLHGVGQSLSDSLTLVAAGSATERPDLLMARADLRGLVEQVTGDGEPPTRERPLRAGRTTRSIAPRLALFDTPPVLTATETSALAAAADAVVLVVRIGVTPRSAASTAADQLRKAGGTILGTVVVGARTLTEGEVAPASPATTEPAARDGARSRFG